MKSFTSIIAFLRQRLCANTLIHYIHAKHINQRTFCVPKRLYVFVAWLVAFPLIFAEVLIRNPRIIKKEELKNRALTSNFGIQSTVFYATGAVLFSQEVKKGNSLERKCH